MADGCTLLRPTPETLWTRVKNAFSANVLKGGTVVPESVEFYAVSNDVLSQQAFYSIAEMQWRERDPRYACCDNLVAMASNDGIYPRPATNAVGYIKLTGTPASPLNTNMQFQIDGKTYNVDTGAALPAQLDGTGTSTIRVIADQPGAAGNIVTTDPNVSSVTGSLTTPTVGVNEVVVGREDVSDAVLGGEWGKTF